MRTLIVPCAGGRKINQMPVYINYHPDGKLFAEKAILGVRPDLYDQIIYAILAEDQQRYDAESILKKELTEKYNVKICVLESKTSGPAETVYKAIKMCNVVGEFAVRDCLNWIAIDNTCNGNFIAGLDLAKYSKNILNLRSMSFIVTNEQHQVLDVIEKKFRSDIISVGLYGFESAEDYLLAYEHLNDSNYPIKKLYVSHIMSYLIGYKNKIFHYAETKKFEDWSSLEAYSNLQRDYAICLVDLDALYGENLLAMDNVYVNSLFERSKDTHISFIMFTGNPNVDRREIEKKYREAGINCTHVIYLDSKSQIQHYVSDEIQLESAVKGV